LYGRHAVDSGAEVLGTITRKRREGGIDLGDGAAPPFNLGNMLRATGRKVEAEAGLRAATRADPTFAEAWYNLSDLLDEQGRSQAGSIVCGVRLRPRPTMPTRCLILRFRYSEVVGTRKPRSTGGNILPTMLNLNGQHGRVDP
jgi:hypothetical protein